MASWHSFFPIYYMIRVAQTAKFRIRAAHPKPKPQAHPNPQYSQDTDTEFEIHPNPPIPTQTGRHCTVGASVGGWGFVSRNCIVGGWGVVSCHCLRLFDAYWVGKKKSVHVCFFLRSPASRPWRKGTCGYRKSLGFKKKKQTWVAVHPRQKVKSPTCVIRLRSTQFLLGGLRSPIHFEFEFIIA